MSFFPSCAQNPSAWYCGSRGESYGQSFNGNTEHGNDIDAAFHTPVTNVFAGTVTDASYHAWGGQVGVLTTVPGLGKVIEYIQHLDFINPNITVGSTVTAGESLGLSGGQLGYGLHPNSPADSSGPHLEWGFDAPWVSGLQPGMPVFPNTNSNSLLTALRAGQVDGNSGSGPDPTTCPPYCLGFNFKNPLDPNATTQCLPDLPGCNCCGQPNLIGANSNPNNLPNAANAAVSAGVQNALGIDLNFISSRDFWVRFGLIAVGVLVLVVGLAKLT